MQRAFYVLNVILVYGGFLLLPSDMVAGMSAALLGWWLGMMAYAEEVGAVTYTS